MPLERLQRGIYVLSLEYIIHPQIVKLRSVLWGPHDRYVQVLDDFALILKENGALKGT